MSTPAETGSSGSEPAPAHRLRLDPPPAALVVEGRYRFGTYDAPISAVNPLDVVGGPRWTRPVRRRFRELRMKEWEAFQLGNDEWFVLGAVYDAKVVALLQVIAVHKASGRIHRWERKVPSPLVSVARGLDGTRSHGRTGGFSLVLGNDVSAGRLTVDASHPGSSTVAALELHGVGGCDPERSAHLVICHPFGHDRALYSDKCMMPFTGVMRVGNEEIVFEDPSSFMILDDHHGEYPSPMAYDWVTGIRRDADGTVVGLNLTHNQVRAPERFNENAVWIGNEVFRLPAVHFARPDGVHGRWSVTDSHGRVDVGFTPSVRSEMHVGPRRWMAEYYAPYGWLDGRITTAEGRTIEFDGFFGVGEQKLIRF